MMFRVLFGGLKNRGNLLALFPCRVGCSQTTFLPHQCTIQSAVKGAELFDNKSFQITKLEADTMDPQQRPAYC